jgi:hypothetical protein
VKSLLVLRSSSPSMIPIKYDLDELFVVIFEGRA